jgi:sugar lactone lactonase YvrE
VNKSLQILNSFTAIIGECSRWHEKQQCLYWIDVQKQHLYRYNENTALIQLFQLPAPLKCIDFDTQGDVIGIMANALVKISINDNILDIKTIRTNLLQDDDVSFNDGRLDAQNNLWIGTMDLGYQKNIGKLFRINPNGEMIEMDKGFITSNGMGWSPDKTRFYFTDSLTRCIYRYRFNQKTCQIDNREVFIQYPEKNGYPDGLYIDQEGFIWVAGWASYHIYQYSPKGKLVDSLAFPAKNLTSCCFGGKDLKTLYVTSANFDLSDLSDVGEHAGALFKKEMG